MKRIPAFILLAALSFTAAIPAKAQIFMGKDSVRRAQKAAKKQQKRRNKAARKQQKALNKAVRKQQKAMKKAQHRA
jgi:uncharacterized membrane protein (DUF106 family)